MKNDKKDSSPLNSYNNLKNKKKTEIENKLEITKSNIKKDSIVSKFKNNNLDFKISKFKSKRKKYIVKKPLIIPEKKYPIEYKRLGLLRHFLTKYGKIRPRRVSKIPLKQQRKIGKAIRRARGVGLIPCSIIAKSRKNTYASISKK